MTDVPATTPVLETVELPGGAARIDLPVGWTVDTGPPTVATPPTWPGEPPAVVVSVEDDALAGEDLAMALAAAAATRLTDPVIVSLDLVGRAGVGSGARDSDTDTDDSSGSSNRASDRDSDDRRDVQIVVAHRHRGVDVTTVERHHCHPSGPRWAIGFTAAHPDAAGLLPLAHRVVASLRVEPAPRRPGGRTSTPAPAPPTRPSRVES